MGVLRFGLIWIVLQVVIFESGAIGAIQLYKTGNYSELLLEINPTNECSNIPSENWIYYKSAITDTCVILYSNINCKSAFSHKYMPGKASHDLWGATRSLQKCDEKEGGPTLNLDITTYIRFTEIHIIPTILERYTNVCRCINIPKYVQNMEKWSIDNHNNGLFAYFEPDCKEQYSKPLYIDAGNYLNSRFMHMHSRSYKGSTNKIQSIGPAPNTTYFQQSCSSLPNDKIMKLELFEAVNNSGRRVNTNSNPAPPYVTSGSNDDPIHFFADTDYQGFRFGSRSSSKCYNFPKPVQSQLVNGVGSIQTNNCMIVYMNNNCTGRSVKIEAPGSNNLTNMWESTITGEHTLSLLYTQNSNWKWVTKSFQLCNKNKGGLSLNVEIYSGDPNVNENDGPVEYYENVCSCHNIPDYVQRLRWSINNNGNPLIAYFSPDCASITYSPLWIPAGESSYSLGLGLFRKVDENTGVSHKIQSFGPDPNSDYFIKNCNKSCTELSLLGNELTELNATNICGFGINSESTQVAILLIKRMQVHEAKIEKRNKDLQLLLEKAAMNLENMELDFNDKLEKQKDEMQQLTYKLNSHIHQ